LRFLDLKDSNRMKFTKLHEHGLRPKGMEEGR